MSNAQSRSQSIPSVAFKLNEVDRGSNDGLVPGLNNYQVRLCVQPVLRRLRLSWKNDVQEVYPLVGTSIWAVMKEMPFRHKGIFMTSASDPNLVCEAVKLCLTRWPIFRTVAVEYSSNLRLFVALRAQKTYFDRAISIHPEVDSVEAFRALNIQLAPHPRGEIYEGLSFNAVIARIKDTGTVGVLFIADHASYDGSTLTAWATDLGRIIRREPAVDRAPYKMFADAYYTYQDSEPAREARDFHRRIFQQGDIPSDALWPPGKDLVPVNLPEKKSYQDEVEQQINQPPSKGANNVAKVAGRITQIKKCPILGEAYTKRGMHASIIVKMAVCLFNCLQTGKEHAIFRMVTSGRVWPFIHPEIAAYLPDPNNIAGPTVVSQVDVTRVAGEQTINQLYARVKEEQKLFNQYPHVPQRMLEQLNEGSGGIWHQARRQTFDWVAGYEKRIRVDGATGQPELEMIEAHGETTPPPGVLWFCRLTGDDSLMVRLIWNPMLFSKKQAHAYANLVHELVEWICEPGNGEKRVEELRLAFEQKVRESKREKMVPKL